MSKPIVILGAGCAGLAAAWRLRSRGREVLLIEAEDHVGGLAGGVRIGGNVYEYGPHIFHTTDPEILNDIKGLMGPELLPYTRTIRIKFLDNYFRFPLSMRDVLAKLPVTTVLKAGLSFAYWFAQGALVKPKIETSETVLRRCYGDVLYKLFFKDYIEHVWGIPPAQFSPAFARERIPRFNLLESLESLTSTFRWRPSSVVTRGYVEKVEGELYTTREGFSMITERMARRLREAGAILRLETRVIGLKRQRDAVSSVLIEARAGREETPCAAVVNTLPVSEVARLFDPPLPPPVLDAAALLRFRAIVFVGLKVRRRVVLPASFMYFREHSFNRITDLSHFSFHIEPPGRTLLVAEVTCDPSERPWSDEAYVKEQVIGDLVRESLLLRDEIEAAHVFRARYAHPMYTLGYEKTLAALLSAIASFSNAETAGRQGRFQYVNTHVAMKMGYEAAERLMARGF